MMSWHEVFGKHSIIDSYIKVVCGGIKYYLVPDLKIAKACELVGSLTKFIIEPEIVYNGVAYPVEAISGQVLNAPNLVIKCHENSALIEFAFEGYNIQIVERT